MSVTCLQQTSMHCQHSSHISAFNCSPCSGLQQVYVKAITFVPHMSYKGRGGVSKQPACLTNNGSRKTQEEDSRHDGDRPRKARRIHCDLCDCWLLAGDLQTHHQGIRHRRLLLAQQAQTSAAINTPSHVGNAAQQPPPKADPSTRPLVVSIFEDLSLQQRKFASRDPLQAASQHLQGTGMLHPHMAAPGLLAVCDQGHAAVTQQMIKRLESQLLPELMHLCGRGPNYQRAQQQLSASLLHDAVPGLLQRLKEHSVSLQSSSPSGKGKVPRTAGGIPADSEDDMSTTDVDQGSDSSSEDSSSNSESDSSSTSGSEGDDLPTAAHAHTPGISGIGNVFGSPVALPTPGATAHFDVWRSSHSPAAGIHAGPGSSVQHAASTAAAPGLPCMQGAAAATANTSKPGRMRRVYMPLSAAEIALLSLPQLAVHMPQDLALSMPLLAQGPGAAAYTASLCVLLNTLSNACERGYSHLCPSAETTPVTSIPGRIARHGQDVRHGASAQTGRGTVHGLQHAETHSQHSLQPQLQSQPSSRSQEGSWQAKSIKQGRLPRVQNLIAHPGPGTSKDIGKQRDSHSVPASSSSSIGSNHSSPAAAAGSSRSNTSSHAVGAGKSSETGSSGVGDGAPAVLSVLPPRSFSLRLLPGDFHGLLASGRMASGLAALAPMWGRVLRVLASYVQANPLHACTVLHAPPGLMGAWELAELQSAHVLAPRYACAARRTALLMGMHPRLGAASPLRYMPSDLLASIMDASLPRASPRMALHLSKWMPGAPREDDDQGGGVAWPAQDVLAAAAFLL